MTWGMYGDGQAYSGPVGILSTGGSASTQGTLLSVPAGTHTKGTYTAITGTYSGTATSVNATSLTDTTANRFWIPNALSGRTVTMGGSTGYIVSNTTTVLSILAWSPSTPAAGAYTIPVSTCPFDAAGFIWNTTAISGTGRMQLCDISFDGGTTAHIENLYIGTNANSDGHSTYFPHPVAAGATIHARYQTATASQQYRGYITFVPMGYSVYQPGGFIRTHGVVRTASRGTLVSPGGSVGVYGTAQTLPLIRQALTPPDDSVPASVEPYSEFYLSVGCQGRTNHPDNYHFITIQDSSGNEIIKDLVVQMQPSTSLDSPSMGIMGPFPCHIPAGTTIQAKQRTSDSVTASDLDIAFYGVVR